MICREKPDLARAARQPARQPALCPDPTCALDCSLLAGASGVANGARIVQRSDVRIRRPTADEVLAAFGGRVLAPTGRQVVIGRSMGMGGRPPDVRNLSLTFKLGAVSERLEIDLRRREQGYDRSPKWLEAEGLVPLVLSISHRPRLRFPIVIERGRIRIPVEGRERAFATFTAGSAAVAVAAIGELDVTITCLAKRLSRLQLDRLDRDVLEAALQRSWGAAASSDFGTPDGR